MAGLTSFQAAFIFMCGNSLAVDKSVDNPVDKLWITLWITQPRNSLWITPRLIHSLSTGKAELSTILSTGWMPSRRDCKPLIHSFHRPYY
ncbi:MAG: hypothetical protein ACR2J4_10805, partial [Deinococcus sp.]